MNNITNEAGTTVKGLLLHLAGCQATHMLYTRAQESLKEYNGRDLAIVLVPQEKAPFGALCQYPLGEIWLNSTLGGNEAISTLIFELANMVNAKRFHDVSMKAVNKEITKEEFARQMEEVEYESVLLHANTIQKAVEEQGSQWLALDYYHNSAMNVNWHLTTQKQAGHSDYYHQWWDENIV